jgi:3-oxoacyl-[acyl-carrier protein] reductase
MQKIALVTGAGRNIGRAMALSLARDGFDVAVNVRQSVTEGEEVVREITAIGRQAILCVADVCDQVQVQNMFDRIAKAWGRLDVLVNNAAVRAETELGDITLKEWRRILSICLDGAFLCAQSATPLMRQAGGGSIVNIGGLTAHTGAVNRLHVVTAKAGLVGFTRALAEELAPQSIRVNCVSPGLIDTVRIESSAPAAPVHHKARTNFMKRRGTSQEVADVVSWLASSQSSYVTGQVVHVNGGAYLGS